MTPEAVHKGHAQNRPGTPANPCLFVVGCPRSGTTLLQRMLHNHPQLAVAYDSLFIPAAVRGQADKNPPVSADLVERIETFHRFPRLGLPEGIVTRLAPGARDYAELVQRIYDAFAALHGKPLGGEKSPGYVRHMPMLHDLFPDARFIHLVRDGRNVALSLLDWGKKTQRPKGPARKYRLWQESPVAVSALWWARKAGRGRRDAQRLPPDRYQEVSYEQLVDRPEDTLKALSGFLGLPYSEDMVHFYRGKTRKDPGLSAKSAWLPATKGIRNWRRSMSAEDVELFEALAGDWLTAFGYERAFPEPSPAVRAQAEQLRNAWSEELAARPRDRRGAA